MIRLPWFWPSKNAKSEAAVTPEDLRVVQAFNSGYLLAMTEGLKQLNQTLFDRATEEALARLDTVITARAHQAGVSNPQPVIELQRKQRELQQKLSNARSDIDRAKYTHYLEALEWALHANGLHSNES